MEERIDTEISGTNQKQYITDRPVKYTQYELRPQKRQFNGESICFSKNDAGTTGFEHAKE